MKTLALFFIILFVTLITISCSESTTEDHDVCDCVNLLQQPDIDENTRHSCEEVVGWAKESNENYMEDCK